MRCCVVLAGAMVGLLRAPTIVEVYAEVLQRTSESSRTPQESFRRGPFVPLTHAAMA